MVAAGIPLPLPGDGQESRADTLVGLLVAASAARTPHPVKIRPLSQVKRAD